MTTEQILSSDPLDLLFSERNKSYGAYPLRKFYPNRIKLSLLIMFGLAFLFSAFTLLPGRKAVATEPAIITRLAILQKEAPVHKEEKPKHQQPAAGKQHSTQKFVPNIVLTKDTADQITTLVDHVRIGSVDFVGDPAIADVVDPNPAGTQPAAPAVPEAPEVADVPDANPDIQASFPGGERELVRFLQNNLRAPAELDPEETVLVKVRFVVGFDGNLQSFDVVKDGGDRYNQEVVRVLKKMPRWIPGKKGGKNIPVYYTIPVKFTATE